ncbi:MAG: AAA family ATPase, partial [Lentisphaerota bacterium]
LLNDRENAVKDKFAIAENKQKEADKILAEGKLKLIELTGREDMVFKREENAKDGFLEERKEHLKKLQDEAAKLRTLIDETNTWCSQRRVEAEKELANLKQRELGIQIAEKKIKWGELDLKEMAQALAAYEIQKVQSEKNSLDSRLKAALDDAKRHLDEKLFLESNIARLGGRQATDIINENRRLDEENKKLKIDLVSRPNVNSIKQLDDMKITCDQHEETIQNLRQELAEQSRKVNSAVIAVTEVESLRDQKLTMEKRCELLANANESLRTEYDQIITKAGQKTPFESCSAKDNDKFLQSCPAELRNAITLEDLPRFTEELRHRIALNPENGEKRLYYSIEDIRCFLAGLAMSRLHIIQGISGTGKTSLPKAFARAVGAGCEIVPVQAGWRDREDLIGHYNSFQNKYYESDFLKALYDAQCPQYEERIFNILLDEMNLSHPEQYFADFISLMEQDRKDQVVSLTTFPVPNAPLKFVDKSKLRIPDNVWFIGTANHDETTMDFADKTYDRAHVMELPRHRNPFKPDQLRPNPPVSLNAFIAATKNASSKFGEESQKAAKYLDDNFLEMLGTYFNIGWGNRLERQLQDFVPVVMACGGSIGEATDHILASKILRKLRGRHDNTEKDLKEIEAMLDDNWIDKKHKPIKSKAVIEEMLRTVA